MTTLLIRDVGLRENERAPRDTDDAFIGAARDGGREIATRRFRDVLANNREIAVGEGDDVGATGG